MNVQKSSEIGRRSTPFQHLHFVLISYSPSQPSVESRNNSRLSHSICIYYSSDVSLSAFAPSRHHHIYHTPFQDAPHSKGQPEARGIPTSSSTCPAQHHPPRGGTDQGKIFNLCYLSITDILFGLWHAGKSPSPIHAYARDHALSNHTLTFRSMKTGRLGSGSSDRLVIWRFRFSHYPYL